MVLEDGYELTTQVEVTGVRRTPSGLEVTEGRAAAEYLTDREKVSMNGSGISRSTEPAKTTRYTEFLVVDGEFVVVQNARGRFLFDILEDRHEVTIERASIDLDHLLDRYGDGTPWKVGFRGHTDVAENGVIHGESVLADELFGEALRTAEKNQLGLKFSRDGRTMKMMATASGYLEIYQPSNFTANEFCTFLTSEVRPALH